jgi:AraC-like DNA-binding protein
VILVFSFGPEWRIGNAHEPAGRWERHTSFIAGLHESSVLTEHDGYSVGMQVSLTPPGAYALLGLPMKELAGLTVDLEDVLEHGSQLSEQLATLNSWAERFKLLDLALGASLENARPPSPCVEWAWGLLMRTHGCVGVDFLAAELGWSRKRLGARFREQIGLSPKTAARMLRFEHARALLQREDHLPLAEVAQVCGYYDQAHLTNEVRRITGVAPSVYRADLWGETNLQDAGPHSS